MPPKRLLPQQSCQQGATRLSLQTVRFFERSTGRSVLHLEGRGNSLARLVTRPLWIRTRDSNGDSLKASVLTLPAMKQLRECDCLLYLNRQVGPREDQCQATLGLENGETDRAHGSQARIVADVSLLGQRRLARVGRHDNRSSPDIDLQHCSRP